MTLLYYRDDKEYISMDLNGTVSVPRLPPGTYSATTSMSGVMIYERNLSLENHVPTDSPARDRLEREFNIITCPVMRARAKEHGLLFKRGVFMHGDPGTGKTSMVIHSVQKRLAAGMDMVVFWEPATSILTELLEIIDEHNPDTPIVIVYDEWESRFSAGEHVFLDVLDGSESRNNMLFIAITNHKSKFPSRVIDRPSRFSSVIEVPKLDDDISIEYMKTWNLDDDLILQILEKCRGKSFDHLKQVVVEHCVYNTPIEYI